LQPRMLFLTYAAHPELPHADLEKSH